jgi:hypothetical protein
MQLTRDGMARHVAEQSLAWQRGIAQDRIALLTKEAAQHHNDNDLVDALGHAAASAARAHSRVGDGPPGGEAADAAAAQARSGVLGAAIQARLDRGDTTGANALLTRVQEQLDPAHAGPIQRQIDTVQRLGAAKDYADGIASATPATSLEEIDAQHHAALQQAAADHPDDPRQQTLAWQFLNQAFDARRQELQQAAGRSANTVNEWLNTPGPDGGPQRNLPSAAVLSGLDNNALDDLVTRLDPNDSRVMLLPDRPFQDDRGLKVVTLPDKPPIDGTLDRALMLKNLADVPEGESTPGQSGGRSERPGRGIAPVVEPLPGSPEYEAANAQVEEAEKAARILHGTAPLVEPSPGTPEYNRAAAQVPDALLAQEDIMPGDIVVLPNGQRVADGERLDDRNKRNKSPTGYMMSPVTDLAPVAEAGRRAGVTYRSMGSSEDPSVADQYLDVALLRAVGTGGTYDYQRRGPQLTGLAKEALGMKDTFGQRPQFRNVSNFNVGLYSQQAGLSLEDTLEKAGQWARLIGSTDQSQPHGLFRQTAKFIEEGYKAGQSGAFDVTTKAKDNQ